MNLELLAQMNQPVAPCIPAGLEDDDIEFYAYGTHVNAIYDGARHRFEDWGERALTYVERDMEKHPEALACLVELGLEERLPAIRQYTRCRFGGCDKYSDITSTGQVEHTEYWDCGFRGKCPYEGRLCSTIKVANGILSARQIDVIKLIYEGKQAKEIAADLKISVLTVGVHIQNIFKATGLRSSAEIVRFAAEKMIYSQAIKINE